MNEFYIVFRHKRLWWKFHDELVRASDPKQAVLIAASRLRNPDDWEVDQVWGVKLWRIYVPREMIA